MKKSENKNILRFFLITGVLFLAFLFLKKDNVIRWVQAGFTLKQQEKTIERYRSEIERMDRQIDLISNDKDTLETFARENFGFAEPGDDVYLDKR